MHFHCLHGAWHGAWVWEPLVKLFSDNGYTVSAPDLPGLGDGADDLDKTIDLESHIEAAYPPELCWLVAHSYAGVLARAITDRHADRVAGIVLIEALWPVSSGQSVIDLLSAEAANTIMQKTDAMGDGWKIPPPPVSQFAIKDRQLESSVEARLTDQPLATFQQPLNWSNHTVPDIYLIASDRDPQPYAETARKLLDQGTEIARMSGGHNLMLTNPVSVFQTIASTVESTTTRKL